MIRYQVMLAARQQDPDRLLREYQAADHLVLSIDGLQPEKGHETLYVVPELGQKRVWFAAALLSATEAEVGRLIAQAREWAERLGELVKLWMSDKRAAVRGILNDDQGGPLHPPGLRMAEALGEVRQSLQRDLEARKGGGPRRC